MQNIAAVEIKTKQWLTMGVGWSLEQLGRWTQLISELRRVSESAAAGILKKTK